MKTKKPGVSSARARTDKSLSDEREKTDVAISGDRSSAESKAEGVIQQARGVADAAVKAERLKADEEARLPARPAKVRGMVGKRAKADRATRGQRDTADAALRADLKGRADALEALLVLERAATDAHLLTERVRSDGDVSNRDDFLGMVAHDVRNLLNLVLLGLEAIRPDDGAEVPAYVVAGKIRIRRYVARMNRLIGDLVDVTSIDAGKLAVEPVKGDAAALVAEATEAFIPAAAEKGVSLIVEIPEGPLFAVFDHDRILQVCANVLSNAIKFTPRDGRITVSVKAVRGALRICTSDTGIGIPEPMLEAVFERFWQLGRNDRRGMGLGLYISKSIMEAHGGRIWAESQPGKGSQLYFTIPITGARSRRRPARVARPPRKRARTAAADR